jgi:hypothetical protein
MNKIRDGRVFSLVHLTWNDLFADTGIEPRTVQPIVYSLYRLAVTDILVCNFALRLSEA